MKNYDSRLQAIEDKLNPKTSLFQVFATNTQDEKILIKQQIIPRFKNQDSVNLIIGRGIYSDEQIGEELKVFKNAPSN